MNLFLGRENISVKINKKSLAMIFSLEYMSYGIEFGFVIIYEKRYKEFMISPTQMRAARAMLDKSQGDVAEYLGIAANTLSKIESGQSDISVTRNAEIQKFYEREGIAFTENDGVQWNSGGVEAYEGRSGFLDFMDDVFETAKSNPFIHVNNVDEAQFQKWIGDFSEQHVQRMNQIKNLEFNIIIKEGDRNTVASTYAKYRYVEDSNFGNIPLYIYGEKTALIVFNDDNVEIFVIKHKAIKEYFTKRFFVVWQNAREV